MVKTFGPGWQSGDDDDPRVIGAPDGAVAQRDDLSLGYRRVVRVVRDAKANVLRRGGAGGDNEEKKCPEGRAAHLIAR